MARGLLFSKKKKAQGPAKEAKMCKKTLFPAAVRLVLIVAGVLFSASRCKSPLDDELVCTLMGCSDMLTMAVTVAGGGDYVGGSYTFAVEAASVGTVTLSCEITAGEAFGTCYSDGQVDQYLTATGDGQTLTLVLEGGWGEMNDETAHLTVTLNGDILGEETLTPTWLEIYPNGKDCDESPCYQAEESVTL